MKILFISIDFPPDVGGVANYYKNICQNLEDVDLTVLTEQKSGSETFDSKQGYKIIRKDLFYKTIWPKWLKMLFTAYKIVKQEKPDWVFVGQVLPVGTAVYFLQKIFKFRYLVFSHGTDIGIPMTHARKRQIMTLVFKKANNIIANSHYTMKRLAKIGINEDKIVVMFPCPDRPVAYEKLQNEISNIKNQYNLVGKLVFLTIGRLVERKGIDNVFEALSLVKHKYQDFIYLVIGKGTDKNRLNELIRQYGLEDNVKMVGYISENEKPIFYNASDIYIMTGREVKGDVEGFGLVYLEANSYGKPVIASRTGGVIEAVIDKETGLLVDQGNTEQIKNVILQLAEDRGLRKQLGENGKKRVKEKFQWQEQINKLKNILQ